MICLSHSSEEDEPETQQFLVDASRRITAAGESNASTATPQSNSETIV
jgi:hypothetical protein